MVEARVRKHAVHGRDRSSKVVLNRATHRKPIVGDTRPKAAATKAPEGPKVQAEVERLMGELKALRVEYEKFFNGALEVPPEELRGRLSSQIKRLRNSGSKSIADDFLLASLEAQFNSYNELFGRRLRIAEEGRGVTRPATPAERTVDATKGVVCRDGVEADAATALYRALEQQGPPRFDLDSFHTYLTRQLSAIREKTGCSAVHFRIAAEDGQLKLKARPVTTA